MISFYQYFQCQGFFATAKETGPTPCTTAKSSKSAKPNSAIQGFKIQNQQVIELKGVRTSEVTE